jgi:hypothetical protein
VVRETIIVWTLLTLAGCGAAGGAPVSVPEAAPARALQVTSPTCLVSPDSALPAADTVNILVAPPSNTHPTDPLESEGDRFILRHAYETLVRVDCEGNVVPGLAVSWKRDATGSVWAFEIAAGRTFADGTPIDAGAIVAAWERQLTGPSAWPHIAGVQAVGVRSIEVRFDTPAENAPRALSDQHFAIRGAPTLGGKPAESGPFTISVEPAGGDGMPGATILTPRGTPGRGTVLRLAAAPPGFDLRDAIDRGISSLGMIRVDLLITRDPDLLAYVARRDEVRTVPLPWDRTYVLAAQSTPDSSASRLPPLRMPSPASRGSLARDAVKSDARGAEPPYWWQQDSACIIAAPRIESPRRVVAYRAGDAIAKELAERIVALASSPERPDWIPGTLAGGSRPSLRVVAFAPDSFDDAIASGRVIAAVVAYPREQPTGCAFAPHRMPNAAEIPLVDSRAHVIVRRRGISFSIEGDGSIRFLPDNRP